MRVGKKKRHIYRILVRKFPQQPIRKAKKEISIEYKDQVYKR